MKILNLTIVRVSCWRSTCQTNIHEQIPYSNRGDD